MSRRRMRKQRTGNGRFAATSLLFIGLVFGLIGGLTYAWVVDPVVYVDGGPARLSQSEKSRYLVLVSQSYAVSGNWEEARRRLFALQDPLIEQTVAQELDDLVRKQADPAIIANFAAMARVLGVQTQAVAIFAPTPAGVVPTPTPVVAAPVTAVPPTPTLAPTSTAVPTLRPSPTPQPNYRLLNQERICLDDKDHTLIEVNVLDAMLDPQPGTEIIVRWGSEEDHFYTGFKPENGAGYADFEMSPDISYTLVLAEGSPEVSGLRLEQCDSGYLGGWRLTYQNLRTP